MTEKAIVRDSVASTTSETSSHVTGADFQRQTTDQLASRLADARRAGRRRLLFLRGPTLSLGAILILSSFALQAGRAMTHPLLFLLGSGSPLGSCFLLLSLLPNDKRAVPIVLIFRMIMLLLQGVMSALPLRKDVAALQSGVCEIFNGFGGQAPCWAFGLRTFGVGNWVCVSLALSVRKFLLLGHWNSTDLLLSWLWQLYAIVGMSTSVVFSCFAIAYYAASEYLWAFICIPHVIASLLAVYTSCRPHRRQRIQAWLMSHGENATAAAGISSLLGGNDVGYVLSKARDSFYSVPAQNLMQEHMAIKNPDASLAKYAARSRLGEVDAFVSHSWSDDAESKWSALQRWREDFKTKHAGREPKLWIDKYSIDQENIDVSLACLPVYLSGCKRLLVLCGTTYLQRLWCLVEIFVFLEMGGELSNLEVRLLGQGVELVDAIVTFDPQNARCFTDHDTDRLQAVIAIAGHHRMVNLVRTVFSCQVSAPTNFAHDAASEKDEHAVDEIGKRYDYYI